MDRNRGSTIARLSIVTCFAVLLLTSLALQAEVCDSTYVQQSGLMLTVAPSGSEDTVNLQCAFDYAATLGTGANVQLLPGTFHTAQLIINGVNGTIHGAGQGVTIIQNRATQLSITNPYDFYTQLPSLQNLVPALITVRGNNLIMSDFSLRVVGVNPVVDYYSFGFGPLNFVAWGILVYGSDLSLRLERLEIGGSPKCFPDPELNLITDVNSFNMGYQLPWSSNQNLVITDSTFLGCQAVFAYDLTNSKVLVTGNKINVLQLALVISDIWNSSVTFSNNQVTLSTDPNLGAVAVDAWSGNFGTGIRDSSLVLRNNRFWGPEGIFMEGPFAGNINCALVGNNVQNIADMGYLFLPGTYGCTVVGHTGDNAVDLAGTHIFTGLTPHPAAGHTIAPLLRNQKPHFP